METAPPDSELRLRLSTTQLTATTHTTAAWLVFGLMLGCHRPVQLEELAYKCSFLHDTPHYIQFLCSIPDSPLFLTAERLVTFSKAGFVAVTQFFANSDTASKYFYSPAFFPQSLKVVSNELVETYYSKRKRMRPEVENFSAMKRRIFNDTGEENADQSRYLMPNSFQNVHTQEYLPNGELPRKTMFRFNMSSILTSECQEQPKFISMISALTNSTTGQQGHEIENNGHGNKGMDDSFLNRNSFRFTHPDYEFCGRIPLPLKPLVIEQLIESMPPRFSHPQRILGLPNVSQVCKIEPVNSLCGTYVYSSSQLEVDQQITDSRGKGEACLEACASLTTDFNEKGKELLLRDSGKCRGHEEILPLHAYELNENVAEANYVALLDKSRIQAHLQCEEDMLRSDGKNAPSSRKNTTRQTMDKFKRIEHHTEPQNNKMGKKPIPAKKKLKSNLDQSLNVNCEIETVKENRGRSFNSISELTPQNGIENKPFPKFKSFTIEEEEGSGGYGTVYKAIRKSDGVAFAIKCPHVNANRSHVYNELKMLERFGGKNFVIKYEGSLKNGDSDCVVLEHVEHDRPEVLKKEIDVFQLQWYGYCMFRALAGLHKQGIVHRDVKPGNFLFSRKINKGYLIDFNLALDLHKKYGSTVNSKAGHGVNVNHVSFSQTESLPLKYRNFPNRFHEAISQNAGKGMKNLLPPSNLKRNIGQAKVFTDTCSRNNIKSQGADGSGITSAKDPTSTKTQSGERLREPIPNHGRKELISLVQEALQGGNNESVNAPMSKRKRIAAARANIDSKFFYLTPMPLHVSELATCGTGVLKNKGERKHKREGPCVGTKGFRAPEVLLRSLHQGPKVDIWSAGVTLLYLMIGRTPFVGDPDQNIKEIAKLRGSEDLWEVAKLHNQESLFSTDLFNIKYLLPIKLQDWCAQNTRRPQFLENIPNSLLDLVDKCLTVNPRLRISAEEALKHEFFEPCHEAVRKHRLHRQGLILNSHAPTMSST